MKLLTLPHRDLEEGTVTRPQQCRIIQKFNQHPKLTTKMKIPEAPPFWLRALVAVAASSAIVPMALAQPEQLEEETIFDLSPFEVATDDSVGYLANSTLAGTRLNTRLEDIASAVQVLTPEFLEDAGARDTASLLIYATGTEAGGVSGNFSSAELSNQTARDERVRRSPQANTRVRGLDRADMTRNYFLTDIPFDSYNTNQVTVNRGPNAALFGLGSPGGIVNAGLKRSELRRNFGEVALLWDQFGTLRTTLDINRVVIPNLLAVRFAGLHSNQKFEQKQAFDNDRRYFLDATARPFANTVVRATYEKGEATANRPFGAAPRDRFTGWFENGQPGYNPVTEQWTINGEIVTDQARSDALTRLSRSFQAAGQGVAVVMFDDPDSPQMGNFGYATMQTGVFPNSAGRAGSTAFPDNRQKILRTWGGTRALLGREPVNHIGGRPEIPIAHAAFYAEKMLADRSIFDFRKEILAGPNKREWRDFESAEFTLEQTALQNRVGGEVSYNKQSYADTLYVVESAGTNNTLTVDLNTHLLDGSENPNFGRPITQGQGFVESRIIKRDAFRVTGFAELDFAGDFGSSSDGWLRHLGRHRLTVLYQDQSSDSTAPNRQSENVGGSYRYNIATESNIDMVPGSTRIVGGQRGSTYRALGPSLAGAVSPSGAGIHGVRAWQVPQSTDNALLWNPDSGQMERGSVVWNSYITDPLAVWTWGNPRTLEEIESQVGILQSHFFSNTVVTTVSYRRDSVEQFSGLAGTDPATGLTIPGVVELGPPITSVSEDQSSWGIVVHSPEFINQWLPAGTRFSLHYTDSTNFSAGTAGVDILNRPLDFQTGTTEEYGITFSTLHDRLHVRINRYKTGQVLSRAGSLQTPSIWQIFKLVMENNSPEELATVGFSLDQLPSGFVESVDFKPDNPNVPGNETTWNYFNPSAVNVQVTSDTVSEGTEFEVAFNPTPNWRIHLNASQTDAQVTNVMPVFMEVWEQLERDIFRNPDVGGELWIRFNRTFSDGTVNPESLLINSQVLNGFRSQIRRRTAIEGGAPQELRRWRVNFLTNYSFTGNVGPEWLAGLGVGTGVRWEDRSTIGFALMEVEGEVLPDNTRRIFGPTNLLMDAWLTYDTKIWNNRFDLRLQARIRNLNSSHGLIPIFANPDGENALFRIEPPRVLELSARLKF
jgi:hypothetical protein